MRTVNNNVTTLDQDLTGCRRSGTIPPAVYFLLSTLKPRSEQRNKTADYADFADKHRASMLRGIYGNYTQRCLGVVMAARITFLRRRYGTIPTPSVSALSAVQSRCVPKKRMTADYADFADKC